jgi:LCP family protein required for cell wall assembly
VPGAHVAPKRPRRWPHRLLIGLNIFVAICIVAAGAGYAYVRIEYGKIKRASGLGRLLHVGQGEPKDAPFNVLLVGSDTRATATGKEKGIGNAAQVSGQRSDTIMILHVDANAEKAAILSIPRDLYGQLYDANGKPTEKQRINTSFDKGPGSLVATIEKTFNIPIAHYMEVDFNGFRGIVNAVGGVAIPFSAPARDRNSGLYVFTAGCKTLNGNDALAFARSRHYEYFESGRWREDPTGDLGRIQRQQDFIRRVLRKTISQTKHDPTKVFPLIAQGVKNVTIDPGLTQPVMFRIGKRFHSLSPDTVDMLTLPTVPGSVRIGRDTASILRLQEPEAQQTIDQFLGRTPATDTGTSTVPTGILPNTVRVRVLNGSGRSGEGRNVSSLLSNLGFNVADTGDRKPFTTGTPIIEYGPGQKAKADLLAAYVIGGATLRQDNTLTAVDLTFVTGTGYTGFKTPVKSSTSTTSHATSSSSTTSTTVKLKTTPVGVSPNLDC